MSYAQAIAHGPLPLDVEREVKNLASKVFKGLGDIPDEGFKNEVLKQILEVLRVVLEDCYSKLFIVICKGEDEMALRSRISNIQGRAKTIGEILEKKGVQFEKINIEELMESAKKSTIAKMEQISFGAPVVIPVDKIPPPSAHEKLQSAPAEDGDGHVENGEGSVAESFQSSQVGSPTKMPQEVRSSVDAQAVADALAGNQVFSSATMTREPRNVAFRKYKPKDKETNGRNVQMQLLELLSTIDGCRIGKREDKVRPKSIACSHCRDRKCKLPEPMAPYSYLLHNFELDEYRLLMVTFRGKQLCPYSYICHRGDCTGYHLGRDALPDGRDVMEILILLYLCLIHEETIDILEKVNQGFEPSFKAILRRKWTGLGLRGEDVPNIPESIDFRGKKFPFDMFAAYMEVEEGKLDYIGSELDFNSPTWGIHQEDIDHALKFLGGL